MTDLDPISKGKENTVTNLNNLYLAYENFNKDDFMHKTGTNEDRIWISNSSQITPLSSRPFSSAYQ